MRWLWLFVSLLVGVNVGLELGRRQRPAVTKGAKVEPQTYYETTGATPAKKNVSLANPLPVRQHGKPTTPAAHRAAKTARDVLAVPVIPAGAAYIEDAGQLQGGGGGTTYYFAVVGVNTHGRTTACTPQSLAYSGGDPGELALPITQLAGATAYDVYLSTDADPLWVGRITEAQRATGCIISAVGTVGAGGVAGKVYVQVVGTGRAASVAAVSTAYVIPADLVDCTGREYAHFDVTMALSGDAAAAGLTVTPFLKNARDLTWYADTPVVLDFGGAASHLNSLKQRINVRVFGNAAVALLIQDIAGTGASVNMDVSFS